MRRRSSPREKTFAIGTFVGFFGLLGVVVFDMLRDAWKVHLPGSLRTFLAICLVLGYLVHIAAFLALRNQTTGVVAAVENSQVGRFWIRLLVILLWLGVLPLACLWVYDQLHRSR